MISYLFLILASIMNSVMDTLAHHFSTSIFRNKNESFWNPNISWKYAKYIPLTNYKVDAWHIFKSLMIIFICLAIVYSRGLNLIDFIFLGIIWNFTFSLFYDKILLHKS